MVAEGNDDEIVDVVIPTIPDAVGPMVSQGLSNLGLIPPVTLISPTTHENKLMIFQLRRLLVHKNETMSYSMLLINYPPLQTLIFKL